jgi:glutathione S-transferase
LLRRGSRVMVAVGARRLLTLWGRSSSSNTQKVTWLLHELDLPYDFIAASARLGPSSQYLGEGQPFGWVGSAEFEALNPHHQIPTVRVPVRGGDQLVIWESHSILRYLASEHGPHLHGGTSAGMSRSSMWMDAVLHGSNFAASFGSANHHMIDQIARTRRAERDVEVVARAHAEYIECLHKAEAQLARQRRDGAGGVALGSGSDPDALFLLGDQLQIGDFPVAVELNRWSLCVHAARRDGLQLTCHEFPELRSYYRRLMARPHFAEQVFRAEAQHQQLEEEACQAGSPLAGLPH